MGNPVHVPTWAVSTCPTWLPPWTVGSFCALGAAPRLMIALSGYGEERDVIASHQAGFDRHLVKPVDPELLRTTIMPLASQSRGPRSDAARARARL